MSLKDFVQEYYQQVNPSFRLDMEKARSVNKTKKAGSEPPRTSSGLRIQGALTNVYADKPSFNRYYSGASAEDHLDASRYHLDNANQATRKPARDAHMDAAVWHAQAAKRS